MIKNYLRYAVAAAFVAASGASNVAFAVEEVETPPNDSISAAQRLVMTPTTGPGAPGFVEVTAVLGVAAKTSPMVADVDFYSFHCAGATATRAGDLVTIDIDYGNKAATSDLRSVDTIVAFFSPTGQLLRQNRDASNVDEGSRNNRDARLDKVSCDVDGIYTVGVSAEPRTFLNGGALSTEALGSASNGSYTLTISGVTPQPQVLHIKIDIKPGADSIAPINPKARGSIPVALLSSAKFDALQVDRSSVTFGPLDSTGTKALRCGKGGEDVNGDGRLDLVCHFDNQEANFDPSDEEGMVKGMLLAPSIRTLSTSTTTPRAFEGRGWLKAITVQRPE